MSKQTTTELLRFLEQATDRLDGLYIDGLTEKELKALSLLCAAVQLAVSRTEAVTREEGRLRFFQKIWGLSNELAWQLRQVTLLPAYREATDEVERRFE